MVPGIAGISGDATSHPKKHSIGRVLVHGRMGAFVDAAGDVVTLTTPQPEI